MTNGSLLHIFIIEEKQPCLSRFLYLASATSCFTVMFTVDDCTAIQPSQGTIDNHDLSVTSSVLQL